MLSRLSLCVVAIAATLTLAVPAHASSVRVESGVLIYQASAGQIDELGVYPACPGTCAAGEVPDAVNVYTFDIAGVTPGSGCTFVADADVLGPALLCQGVTAGALIDLGDGDDYFEGHMPGGLPSTVAAGAGNDFVGMYVGDDTIDGGPGKDDLYGGYGADKIIGGEGNDFLRGDFGSYVSEEESSESLGEETGADTLQGGTGDDRLEGNGKGDVLDGGDGNDTALYVARTESVVVSFNDAADDGQTGEGDRLAAVEAVVTGRGNDTVTGDAGPQTVTTGAGDDTITPGGGEDVLDAGAGTDTVDAIDGAADKVSCGEGADSAKLDATDLASDCEQSGQAAGAGVLRQVTPMGLLVTAPGKHRRGARLRATGRLALPAGSDERLCAGTAVVLTARPQKGRAVRLTTTLGADCRFSTTLPLRLKRGGRITLTARFPGTFTIARATSRKVLVRTTARGR